MILVDAKLIIWSIVLFSLRGVFKWILVYVPGYDGEGAAKCRLLKLFCTRTFLWERF